MSYSTDCKMNSQLGKREKFLPVCTMFRTPAETHLDKRICYFRPRLPKFVGNYSSAPIKWNWPAVFWCWKAKIKSFTIVVILCIWLEFKNQDYDRQTFDDSHQYSDDFCTFNKRKFPVIKSFYFYFFSSAWLQSFSISDA